MYFSFYFSFKLLLTFPFFLHLLSLSLSLSLSFPYKVAGSHSDLRPLSGQARTNSTGALQYNEGITLIYNPLLGIYYFSHPSFLSDGQFKQIQPGSVVPSGNSVASLPHHYQKSSSSSASVAGGSNFKRQRSFRESFRKAFTRFTSF